MTIAALSGKGALSLHRALLLGFSVVVICVSVLIGHAELAREKAALDDILNRHVAAGAHSGSIYLREQFERFGEDVRVLTAIPPVEGYARARRNNGKDPFGGSSADEWLKRMATIFTAMMQPNPLYIRMRFIGIDDNGREIVRVDQNDGLISRSPEGDLRQHGDQDYFQDTMKLASGQIHLSSVSPNRKNGVVEKPFRPVLRVATPAYTGDGELVGIFLISIDFELLCARLGERIPGSLQGFLVSDDGDFLWHPDKRHALGFETGTPYRVQDEFDGLDMSGVRAMSEAATARSQVGRDGPMRLFAIRVPYNDTEARRAVTVIVESSEQELTQMLAASRRSLLMSGGGLLLFVLLFTGVFLRKALKPLGQLTTAATEIARGNYRVEIPEVAGKEMAALRSAFISMQSEVSAREAELCSHRDRLQEQVGITSTEVTAIVQSAVNGVVTADENGIIRIFNPAAERMFGWNAADVVGQHFSVLMESGPAASGDFIAASVLSGKGREVVARRRDGSSFPANLAVGHARLSATRLLFVAFISDITLQKRRESELVQAKEMAESAARAKTEFLSNMSHEIRTPMNAILGLAYLMEKQELPAESRTMVQKIHGAGRSLLAIINDILDFSKIEAERLELEHVPFRLSDVLDNLATIMASTLGVKPVELVVGSPPAGADYLTGDGLRLGQVLINLVSNAIKFTERGEVTVAIDKLDDDITTGRAVVRFSVRDTGIGIPESKQKQIFQAFSQADTSTTRSYGGTGLGLAISSRLVELMGGVLAVNSVPGQGSTFSFTLSFERNEPAGTAVPEMTHQRVLIADDHPSARHALADVTAGLGWSSEVVESGAQAVAAVHESEDKPFDVILLDWRMPELDGLEAAERIRNVASQESSPIIVMVTAYDRSQLQRVPGSQVADVVLTKPVTSSCLYNAVQEAKCRRGSLTPALNASAVVQRLVGIRVLVVDDSDINRDVAERILSGEGASVELAGDGSAALTALGNSPDGFDIVLMDMQMPVMDGYTATRQIRATEALAKMPVVALTAGAFKAQRDLALKAGVNAFVAKPFDVEQLVDTIVELTRAASPSASPKAAPSGSPPSSHVVLNSARAASIWRDMDAYGRLLRKFAQTYADSIDGIVDLTAAEAAALMHKMRGAAMQLGLEALGHQAGIVEECLADGGDPGADLPALRSAMAAALHAIDGYAGSDAAPPRDAPRLGNDALLCGLQELDAALDSDDIDMIEPLIKQLAGSLPADVLAPLRRAVDAYDFAEARQLVRGAKNRFQCVAEVLS